MNFTPWIIFMIWFSFAENTPIIETISPEQGIDITTNVTKYLTETLAKLKTNYFEPEGEPAWPMNTKDRQYTHIHTHTFDDVRETPVQNITMEFNLLQFPKFQILFTPVNSPSEMDIFFEVGSISLKAYLGHSDQYIASEVNPFNVKIKTSLYEPRNYRTEIQNLDQIEFKPLNPQYQLKPAEETRAKQIITTYMKKSAYDMVNRPVMKAYIYVYLENMITTKSYRQYNSNKAIALANYNSFHSITSEKTQQDVFYYYTGNVSSTEGTLTNITITSSWNIRGISMDSSNLTKFFTIQFANVRGTLTKCCSCSRNKIRSELVFEADRVNAVADMKVGKMKIKFEDYSLTDAKSNTRLDEEQSKSIVESIESAIETLIAGSPCTERLSEEKKITMPEIDFEKIFNFSTKLITKFFTGIGFFLP
ncbi:uncharacterized protein LOC135837280 isoform X1 [Planococcus citri]|uniref:uncharacterized protein LOC135837280 isoform X1 n=1 Tax=Planococcus citri TaxID=170843 RepID=UPI0031F747FA